MVNVKMKFNAFSMLLALSITSNIATVDNQNLSRFRTSSYRKKLHHRHDRSSTNRHEPQFSRREFSTQIDENVPIGTSILTVRATDEDVDHHGIIEYEVQDTNDFRIDNGGVIYNTNHLDYESTGGTYRFFVKAKNPSSDSSGVEVPIRIEIRDLPDPPRFDSSSYNFSISEMATAGAYVGTVVARDSDNNFNFYSLDRVTPAGLFMIDSENGIITVGTSGEIDINSVSSYEFNAVATDSDVPPNSEQVLVVVTVIDENDNAPVFENCSGYDRLRVRENQTVPENIIMVLATDRDQGVNGQVVYSLVQSAQSTSFIIDQQSGQITAIEPLDRDRNDKERLITVIAKDSAENPLQSACSFTLILEDINDNTPVFDQEVYYQDVPQDTLLNATILRLTATDADAGRNAETAFTLQARDGVSDREFFHIDQNSGVVTLRKALTQGMVGNKRRFRFIARVSDIGEEGEQSRSSTVDVSFSVVSPGAMPPSVEQQIPSQIYISEDSTKNTNIVSLCARSNSGKSSRIYMDIKNGNQKSTNSEGTFDIRSASLSDTGCPPGTVGENIFLATAHLDYEDLQYYMLTITLSNDNGISFDYQVSVQVLDVNDNPPVLQQPYVGSISENAPPSLVMTAKATDKDASPEFRRLRYSFDDPAPNVEECFRIDSLNGDLWTKNALDREERNRYRIPIKVSDGTNVRSRQYWITVNDQNDSPPSFNIVDGKYETEVGEDIELDKDIGLILKVDDADILNEFSFQIVDGNEEKKFKINQERRIIVVQRPLDYDSPINDRNFTLKVRVSDGLSFDTTDVFIKVLNKNDQAPIFNPTQYLAYVTENLECNVHVTRVSAYDPDYPETGQLTYSLNENERKNFTIERETGLIEVKNCLDREATTLGTMYLYPQSIDEGGKGISSQPATVKIVIRDVNDNYPFIQSPPKSYTQFMENVSPEDMTSIVVIQLSDEDDHDEDNGCPCTLSFDESTPPNIFETFRVVEKSLNQYQLLTKKMLDREAQKFYSIPFLTKDKKGLSGIRILEVEVGDENDSPMSDGESRITVYNYRNSFPDILIGSVYVTDADDYDVHDKTFEMDETIPDHNHFSVSLNAGNITMKKATPPGNYTIVVRVHDNKRDEDAKGTVYITVIDLPKEAVMESGSFVIADLTPHDVMKQTNLLIFKGTSLFDRLKFELADLFSASSENVDIFTLKATNVNGKDCVEVRFNVHGGTSYSTASHLNGLLLQHKRELEKTLAINILVVDYNLCLFEKNEICNGTSCQQELRANNNEPLIVESSTSTMVGVLVQEKYTCRCGVLDPISSICPTGFENYCFNGGVCAIFDRGLRCKCPDKVNYGPRCELLKARFKDGFAWYDPLGTCEEPSLQLTFNSERSTALLIYNGPLVSRPYPNYSQDFLYLILRDWVVTAYLNLGSDTNIVSVPLDGRNDRTYNLTMSWSNRQISLSISNCGMNTTTRNYDACHSTSHFTNSSSGTSAILNIGGPLQLGGLAPMDPVNELSRSYGWGVSLPHVDPLDGCISLLKYKGEIYDLNKTSYNKNFARTCKPVVFPSELKMSNESVFIIVGSLLALMLLVFVVAFLFRRRKKIQYYYENSNDIVKETIGLANLDEYCESDVTQYDLNLLRVSEDNKRVNGYGSNQSGLPDIARELYAKKVPISTLSEGFNVKNFIDDNTEKMNNDITNLEDVRHYCFEGDEMSIISLSSISSGSSEEDAGGYNYLNNWGPRFKCIADIYCAKSDEEIDVDSDYEFPEEDSREKVDRNELDIGTKISREKVDRNELDVGTKISTPERSPKHFVPYEKLETSPKHKVIKGEYHEEVNPLGVPPENLSAIKESWC